MRRVFVICALAAALHSSVALGEPIRQPLQADHPLLEQRLFDDADDGTLDKHSLLCGSLIASGLRDDAELAALKRRFESVAQRLRHDARHVTSDRDRAATVLATLHREFLNGPFDAHCGSLAVTITQGRHNCVTAAILYAALAEAIGLPVAALHAPGHVRVRVDGASSFELEPTYASWFKQTEPKLIAWRSAPRELSPAALVGKLYYNQGVVALEAHQFAAAVNAFESSLRLDPSDADAQHNLLAGLSNGALQHCAKRDFTAASAWLQSAKAIDPSYPPLVSNELHLLGQLTVAHCEAHDYTAALTVVQQAATHYPHSDLARGGTAAIYRLWAEALAQKGELHAALARVEAGLAHSPDNAELLRLKQRLAGR